MYGITSYKKKGNTVVSPPKILKKQEQSPFPKVNNLSAQRNENNSGTILGQNVLSGSKNKQTNKNEILSFTLNIS